MLTIPLKVDEISPTAFKEVNSTVTMHGPVLIDFMTPSVLN